MIVGEELINLLIGKIALKKKIKNNKYNKIKNKNTKLNKINNKVIKQKNLFQCDMLLILKMKIFQMNKKLKNLNSYQKNKKKKISKK